MEDHQPQLNVIHRPSRADVVGAGEIIGLVRIARTISLRLHACIAQNDKTTAAESKKRSRRRLFVIPDVVGIVQTAGNPGTFATFLTNGGQIYLAMSGYQGEVPGCSLDGSKSIIVSH